MHKTDAPKTATTPESPGAGTAREEEGWDREQWAGSVTDAPATADDATRWNKAEWAGDQGEGALPPIDPDQMGEGETAISGRHHPPGEQHWAPPGKDSETPTSG